MDLNFGPFSVETVQCIGGIHKASRFSAVKISAVICGIQARLHSAMNSPNGNRRRNSIAV